MKILFVCLGNICRSPLAEGIMKSKVEKAGLTASIKVDSAGFEPFHRGDPPDYRAARVAGNHGLDISNHRARLFTTNDFDTCDLIFIMDHNNYRDVLLEARNHEDEAKVDYLMNVVNPGKNQPVPDPWYGNMKNFEETFKILDVAIDHLLSRIEKSLPE
ncbi:MAG: low molecular weight phosphotyrosine protein phosphatase [Bacteroidetes bacterium]|nr:low molecular weight phosphotyrosine protein phosphatase [Bacteroidota bacterium]